MIRKDVAEECSVNVAQIIVAPKSDGNVRITTDAGNVNRAMQSFNSPIPRHEDIKAKMANAVFFFKT